MSCCDGVNIFSTGAGKVVSVEQDAIPIAFAVDGSQTTFNDLKAIVTSVGFQAQGGYQFMHALREFIYVYVFTERVGEIVINGLAFPDDCGMIGPQSEDDWSCVHGQTGMERVITWYECNRITSRAEPIVIAFGADVAYESFLTSAKVDIANAETGIAQFSLRFNYIPNITDNDDFCFSIDDICLDIPCGEGAQDMTEEEE